MPITYILSISKQNKIKTFVRKCYSNLPTRIIKITMQEVIIHFLECINSVSTGYIQTSLKCGT